MEDQKKIRNQPWYKERLRTKYFKKLKPGETLNAMEPKNWVKLRDNMDDFRDGYPPDCNGVFYLQGSKGISMALTNQDKDTFGSRLKAKNLKNCKQRPFLTKPQLESDRQVPLMKMRHDHIRDVEYGLTQHPLALYPHLEEGMPPELFDELVDILDPAMNPGEGTEAGEGDQTEDEDRYLSDNSSASPRSPNDEKPKDDKKEETGDSRKPSKKPSKKPNEGNNCQASRTASEDAERDANPFSWMLEFTECTETGEKVPKKSLSSPSQDEHIKQVTRKFCEWVTDLGGGTNNIEESTVMSLFASGYETKPALSVPIHVVELSHIPAELRETAGMPSEVAKNRNSTSGGGPPELRQRGNFGSKRGQQLGCLVKTKYGAWYLKPESWRVRKGDEQLEDPGEVEKREHSEAKVKSDAMDCELATIHGSRVFREFLERKQRRMPEFMNKVANLQDIEDEMKGSQTSGSDRNLSTRKSQSRRAVPKTASTTGLSTL